MGTCRNFKFDIDGRLILKANSNSQSFLENCIATVDVVLQDGTRFISQRNDRWEIFKSNLENYILTGLIQFPI